MAANAEITLWVKFDGRVTKVTATARAVADLDVDALRTACKASGKFSALALVGEADMDVYLNDETTTPERPGRPLTDACFQDAKDSDQAPLVLKVARSPPEQAGASALVAGGTLSLPQSSSSRSGGPSSDCSNTDTTIVKFRLADGSLRSTDGLRLRLSAQHVTSSVRKLVETLQSFVGKGQESAFQGAVRTWLRDTAKQRPTFAVDTSAASLAHFDEHRPDFFLFRRSDLGARARPHDISAFVELKMDTASLNVVHAQALRRIDWLLGHRSSRVRNGLWVCVLRPSEVVLYHAQKPSLAAAWTVEFEQLRVGSDEARDALERFFFATHADLGSFLPSKHGPLDLLGAGSTGAVFSLKSSVLKCSADVVAIAREATFYAYLNVNHVPSVFVRGEDALGCLYLKHAVGTPLRSVLSNEDLEAAGRALFAVLAAGVVQRDVRAANFVRVTESSSPVLRLVDFASAAFVSRDPALPSARVRPDGTFVTASDAVLDAFANETVYEPHPRDDWVSLLRMALYSRCPGVKGLIRHRIQGAVHPALVAMGVRNAWSLIQNDNRSTELDLSPELARTASAVLAEAHTLPADFDVDSGMNLLRRLLDALPPPDTAESASATP